MSEYKPSKFEWKKLATDVYAFLQPAWWTVSNSGLIVGKDFATVVDTAENQLITENFISQMKKVTDKPVDYIINTHFHGDHTNTNHLFPGAKTITSHRNRLEMQRRPPDEIEKWLKDPNPPPGVSVIGAKITFQEITMEGTLKLYDGKREIQVIDMGVAHCASDVIVYLPAEKILFAGDIMAAGMSPPGVIGIDRGSCFHMIEVLNSLSAMDAEQYVIGHGDKVLNREEAAELFLENIEFLILTRDESRRFYNQGLTIAEAIAKIAWDKFKKWGTKEQLQSAVAGNLARCYSEFKGDPIGITIEPPRVPRPPQIGGYPLSRRKD